MTYSNSAAIHQYSRVRTHGGVETASPHQLTAMLFDGALSRIASARGHMERGEIAAKGECISRSIDIIGGLRSSLDLGRGGELAERLDSLYDYMERRLLHANLHDDACALDEVSDLLRPIREAWAGIPAELRNPACEPVAGVR
ncbi:MAG: flagellar export chaperone FliS [Xanthomonadales bacterium]|nr:flagellar export chaperone FliS [Xanthomonadales bacterium]ODU95274.1 MAG: flagellar export chaperone FliS [Rhodanobacter sp. SCN 66-43]OJY83000.1 MAG: flagellar export chaperone FliS [Xanthomonadales bacterium 66-474]